MPGYRIEVFVLFLMVGFGQLHLLFNGGVDGDRTRYLVVANDALSQLSYFPVTIHLTSLMAKSGRMRWHCRLEHVWRLNKRKPGQGVGAARSAARTRPLDADAALHACVWGRARKRSAPPDAPDDRGRLVPLAGEGRRGVDWSLAEMTAYPQRSGLQLVVEYLFST